jgi:hypothetical protein
VHRNDAHNWDVYHSVHFETKLTRC